MLGRLDNASVEGLAARKPLSHVTAESGAANKPSNDVTAGHGRQFGFNFGRRKRWEKVRRKKAAENEF